VEHTLANVSVCKFIRICVSAYFITSGKVQHIYTHPYNGGSIDGMLCPRGHFEIVSVDFGASGVCSG
jgi:hypothetical protein